MKKIHLATSKDKIRPHLEYIQIKGGFAYATNCHILVKMPLCELFGKESELNCESYHFYIEAKEWQKNKFYNGSTFTLDGGNYLEALDSKGNRLGTIKIVTQPQFEHIGRYPDCDSVIYSSEKPTEAVDIISFNPSLLSTLCEALGGSENKFIYTFFGRLKTIQVRNKENLSFGILMPIDINMD